MTAGEVAKAAPFSLLALEGSTIQLSAPATVQVGETTYAWTGWSDGEERTHTIEATAPATYTAEYVAEEPPSGQPEETVDAAAARTGADRAAGLAADSD